MHPILQTKGLKALLARYTAAQDGSFSLPALVWQINKARRTLELCWRRWMSVVASLRQIPEEEPQVHPITESTGGAEADTGREEPAAEEGTLPATPAAEAGHAQQEPTAAAEGQPATPGPATGPAPEVPRHPGARHIRSRSSSLAEQFAAAYGDRRGGDVEFTSECMTPELAQEAKVAEPEATTDSRDQLFIPAGLVARFVQKYEEPRLRSKTPGQDTPQQSDEVTLLRGREGEIAGLESVGLECAVVR